MYLIGLFQHAAKAIYLLDRCFSLGRGVSMFSVFSRCSGFCFATTLLFLAPFLMDATSDNERLGFYRLSQTVLANSDVLTTSQPVVQVGCSIPSFPADMSAVAVAVGPGLSAVIREGGKVAAWGFPQTDPFGQPDGNDERTDIPDNLEGVTAISVGVSKVLALRSNGTVIQWPAELEHFETGPPEGLSNVIKIDRGGNLAIALKTDGKVVTWGNTNPIIQPPPSLTNVVDVAASTGGASIGFFVAAKSDGTVEMWGNYQNQISLPPTQLNTVVQVDAGNTHVLALKEDRTVFAWGANDHGQADVPDGLSNVVAVSASGLNSMALKEDGSVVAWGFHTSACSNHYEPGDYPYLSHLGKNFWPRGLTHVTAIAAGGIHSLAIRSTGPRAPVSGAGDFDGDGKADIALTGINVSGGTVPVAFSNGDGNFLKVTNELVGSFPLWSTRPGAQVVAGDFNDDGKADIALTGSDEWDKIPVAFSNGDGTFRVTQFVPVDSYAKHFPGLATTPGSKAIAGDFDGDGRTDIALTGVESWRSIPIAFSNADGTFHHTNKDVEKGFTSSSAAPGAQVVAGDFDGDGTSDIAVTDPNELKIIPVAFSNGDGTFDVTNKEVRQFPEWSARHNAKVMAGDFNGDGTTDLTVTGGDGWSSIPVAFSNGDGSFLPINAPMLGSGFPRIANSQGAQVVAGDFNGNKKADLAVTGVVTWVTIPVAFSNGNGFFWWGKRASQRFSELVDHTWSHGSWRKRKVNRGMQVTDSRIMLPSRKGIIWIEYTQW